MEFLDFKYTTLSLDKAYEMSARHALKVIERNGGAIENDAIHVRTQRPKPVRLEIGFEDHRPKEKIPLDAVVSREVSFEFEGIGFSVNGGVRSKGKGENAVVVAELFIDHRKVETARLPSDQILRKPTPFWRFRLPKGRHRVKIVVADPPATAELYLESAVIYSDTAEADGGVKDW